MNKICLFLIFIFLSLPTFGQDQNGALKVKAWLSLAKELIFQTHNHTGKEDFDASELFEKAMNKLSVELNSYSNSQFDASEMEKALMSLSTDRKSRSELYKDIEEVYIKGVHSKESVFPSSPMLRDEHITEKYRLPWEYYLLMPLVHTCHLCMIIGSVRP